MVEVAGVEIGAVVSGFWILPSVRGETGWEGPGSD
jgi:hypothetical protein